MTSLTLPSTGIAASHAPRMNLVAPSPSGTHIISGNEAGRNNPLIHRDFGFRRGEKTAHITPITSPTMAPPAEPMARLMA
jgi:hypothetical protein